MCNEKQNLEANLYRPSTSGPKTGVPASESRHAPIASTLDDSISARAGVAVPAGNRFGSVNLFKNTRGYLEMCGVGFRVRGIRI